MMLGRGRFQKKELNQEVSLVPFIDLLSMCICFLLATAVWIQIGAVEIKQSHGTKATPMQDRVELEVKFYNPQSINVAFRKAGRTIRNVRLKAENHEALVEKFGDGMQPMLRKVVKVPKGQEGTAVLGDQIGAARVIPHRKVSYGELMAVMDVLRKNKIVNLGVVPVQG